MKLLNTELESTRWRFSGVDVNSDDMEVLGLIWGVRSCDLRRDGVAKLNAILKISLGRLLLIFGFDIALTSGFGVAALACDFCGIALVCGLGVVGAFTFIATGTGLLVMGSVTGVIVRRRGRPRSAGRSTDTGTRLGL